MWLSSERANQFVNGMRRQHHLRRLCLSAIAGLYGAFQFLLQMCTCSWLEMMVAITMAAPVSGNHARAQHCARYVIDVMEPYRELN